MRNLQGLTKKELRKINGGSLIFDLLRLIGAGIVITAGKSVDKDRITPMWVDKFYVINIRGFKKPLIFIT